MALTYCGRKLLNPQTLLLKRCIRNSSYVVLVPEIGEEESIPATEQFQKGQLEFNEFTIEKCVAAIANQSIIFENEIRNIEKGGKKGVSDILLPFDEIIVELERVGTPLDTIWGIAKTLYLGDSATMPTKSYLQIHERARRARSSKFNCNVIYKACQVKTERNEDEELNRVRAKYLIEGKLNGLELNNKEKIKFYEIIKKLNFERKEYKGKLQMATKQFKQTIDDYNLIRDFPESFLSRTTTPSNKGLNEGLNGPWIVTLDNYNEFLRYCPSRSYRYNMWFANATRCSSIGDKSVQISAHLEEIRYLRQQMAQILGYNNFMEMSMETKMVGDLNKLENVLDILFKAGKESQLKEWEQLKIFCNNEEIRVWDLEFYKRKHKESLFGKNNKQNLQFKLQDVLKGIFQFTEDLFNIKIIEHPKKVSTWHRNVKYFDIYENGNLLSNFYFDPYSQKTKDEMIHMISIRNKSKIINVNPIAALICNFTNSPTINLNELSLLLFKFGHLLQHCATQTRYSDVSGLSNIEWDAVDISAYLLNNFKYEILQNYLNIPREIVQNLRKESLHFQGHDICWQLYKTKLDLAVHTNNGFWLDIQKELYPKYNLLKLEKNDSHLLQFQQLFGENENGGGAYFSRIWSKMVAADVFSAFYEECTTTPNKMVGKRFRETFLSKGGASHPSVVFRQFRGRDPCPKALIKQLGFHLVQ